MNKNELNKLIQKSLNSKKKLDRLSWDSLGHLTILTELEKKFPNKITTIKKISEANSYKKLIKLLTSKKLVSND
tara:strand:- start:60 stop:281 length:222 start_codon:yes stop_codon:yes gene_type:complete